MRYDLPWITAQELDRKDWGHGRWNEEPDGLWWQELTYYCGIQRSRLGSLNGYVTVPPEHPWVLAYTDLETDISVHGGLTLVELHKVREINHWFWEEYLAGVPFGSLTVGFDCGHGGLDIIPQLGEIMPNMYSMGERYRTLSYVVRQVRYLVEQAVDAEKQQEESEESP